jgi:hypothetical protein
MSSPATMALLDATALFVIQLLIAQHPQLLDAPEEQRDTHLPRFHPARLLLSAARELHHALDLYRACLPSQTGADEDIPF